MIERRQKYNSSIKETERSLVNLQIKEALLILKLRPKINKKLEINNQYVF